MLPSTVKVFDARSTRAAVTPATDFAAWVTVCTQWPHVISGTFRISFALIGWQDVGGGTRRFVFTNVKVQAEHGTRVELDTADHAILKHLHADARLSMRQLAKLAGVSTPTASAKVKALEALGVIQGYRAVLDPAMLGRAGHVVALRARPLEATKLAAALRERPGVEDVLELAGGLIHVRFFASDAADLQAFMRELGAMASVASYEVHPVLAEHTSPAGVVEPGDHIAVPCHECEGPIHGAGVRKRWEIEGNRDHWFCCRHCAGTYEKRLLATAERASRKR